MQTEPRAPKFTAALSNLLPGAKIVLIDAASSGVETTVVALTGGSGFVQRKTCHYPTKRSAAIKLLFAKAALVMFRILYQLLGNLHIGAISIIARPIRKMIAKEDFDLIVGHTIDTLPIICELAKLQRAKIVFDSMEFYSDMGEGQSKFVQRITEEIESTYLPQCDLVLTSSEELAKALARKYGLKTVLPVYNAAPVTNRLSPKRNDGKFHLYWRNATVGIGQRGLEDAVQALTLLSRDIVLNIQGRPGAGMTALRKKILILGVEERVVFHDAYPAGDAVLCASQYSIGLCLERDTCGNHRFTVSNKIFDYFMAGLAVVCSDLPGLASVVSDSQAGVLYEPGNVKDLAEKIGRLHEDRDQLRQLQAHGRRYAMTRVNEEGELSRFGQGIGRLGFQS